MTKNGEQPTGSAAPEGKKKRRGRNNGQPASASTTSRASSVSTQNGSKKAAAKPQEAPVKTTILKSPKQNEEAKKNGENGVASSSNAPKSQSFDNKRNYDEEFPDHNTQRGGKRGARGRGGSVPSTAPSAAASFGRGRPPQPTDEVSRKFQNNGEHTEEHVSSKQYNANVDQRNSYYFSDNRGTAPSTADYVKNMQYEKTNFPLDKNVNILIERRYSLQISATLAKWEAVYIRVKHQTSDNPSTGALIPLNSTTDELRNACLESMENLDNYDIPDYHDRACVRAPFSHSSEKFLESCRIFPVKEQLEAFPDAIYYCKQCDFHLNTIVHCKTHLEQSTHYEDIERTDQRKQILKRIPRACENQLLAVNKVLRETLDEYLKAKKGDEDLIDRVKYYLCLECFDRIGIKDIKLEPFGSMAYNADLPDSDLNIAFTIASIEITRHYEFLKKVRDQIRSDGHEAEIVESIGCSAVLFDYENVKVRLCWFSQNNIKPQILATNLIKIYAEMQPRVLELIQLVRLWAVKCGVDSKNKQHIGLPRYGFDLMAIRYLQQRGILPVLHEMVDEPETEEVSTDENSSNCSKALLEEARERRIRIMSKYLKDMDKIKEKFKFQEWDLGEIWIGFFRYYVRLNRDAVVQITQKKEMDKDASKWNRKTIHVVDPFRGDNVLSIPKVSTWQPFFFNCLLQTFTFFAIPRTQDGPVVTIHLIQRVKGTKKSKFAKQRELIGTPLKPRHNEMQQQQQSVVAQEERIRREMDDETFNQAADEVAEEDEAEFYARKIGNTLEFDGIKMTALKPDDVEIDDHSEQKYSNRTLSRWRRMDLAPYEMNGSRRAILDALYQEIDYEGKHLWKNEHIARSWDIRRFDLTPEFYLSEIIKEKKREEEMMMEKQRKEEKRREEVKKKEEAQKKEVEKKEAEKKEEDEKKEIKEESVSLANVMKEKERVATPPVEESWKYWNQSWHQSPPSIKTTPQTVSTAVQPMRWTEEDDVEEVTNGMEAMKMEAQWPRMQPQSRNVEPETPKLPEPAVTPAPAAPPQTTGQLPPTTATTATKSSTFLVQTTPRVAPENVCYEEFFIHTDENLKKDVINNHTKDLDIDDYRFEFATNSFSGGYEMEMKCTHCDQNHCVEECPQMKIPPIETYGVRTDEEIAELDAVIDHYYNTNVIKPERLEQLQNKVKELELFLQGTNGFKKATLTIFGSVMTGMSVGVSDIDICFRLGEGDDHPKPYDPVKIIKQIESKLRNSGMAKRVQAITTAKVPIVKFELKLSQTEHVDADISCYNILALYNTQLLKQYTLWTPDNRFAKLGLFVKHWAKKIDIGDASKGSISSYAHVILLISYLQNCDPPVLPRLQEDFRRADDEKRFVENWDTSFFEGSDELLATWQKNKESAAQLFIGFLDYYSRYDFRHLVVQCRRETSLPRLEKEWNRPLCVEDPFDLSHNLGSGVTKKMFVFILKAFIESRKVFMTLKSEKSTNPAMYRMSLLGKCAMVGNAPTDRQCHICQRIGHFAESCPKKTQKNERRRQGGGSSTSTVSSYRGQTPRSRGPWTEKKVEPEFIEYHKRTGRLNK